MKRREFITLLGGGVVAWPRTARSQKPAVPRVGYIWIGARGTDVSNAGLRQGLTDLGYVVGRNLLLEERYANGNPERVSLNINLNTAKALDLKVPAALLARADEVIE